MFDVINIFNWSDNTCLETKDASRDNAFHMNKFFPYPH